MDIDGVSDPAVQRRRLRLHDKRVTRLLQEDRQGVLRWIAGWQNVCNRIKNSLTWP